MLAQIPSGYCNVQAAQDVGHNYIGHNYIGHNYIGHSYIGHIYIQIRLGYCNAQAAHDMLCLKGLRLKRGHTPMQVRMDTRKHARHRIAWHRTAPHRTVPHRTARRSMSSCFLPTS